MQDLTLGGPVDTEETSDRHHGNCNDSVFGCTLCYSAHGGTEDECEYCHEIALCKVRRATDEPTLVAICSECASAASEEAAAMDDAFEDYDACGSGEYECHGDGAEDDGCGNE